MADIASQTLSQYRWPVVRIACGRCNRTADVRIDVLRQRYGDLPLGALARRVAGQRGCALADGPNPVCGVRIEAPPVEQWADLETAVREGWGVLLRCRRHFVARHPTQACAHAVELDPRTLLAALGFAFPLGKLPSRMICPNCGTHILTLEWILPAPPADPGGTAAGPVRLRPQTLSALGRKRFRVIGE